MGAMILASVRSSPAYDIVLIAHVAVGVIGFAAVALTGHYARSARRWPEAGLAPEVKVFFKPGPNVLARLVWLVPVLGVVLVAMSGGAFGWGDLWVWLGVALFGVAAGLLQWVVWPGEGALQVLVAGLDYAGGTPDGIRTDIDRVALRVGRAVAGVDVCYVVAFALMIVKPR
ncbi:MAG: hypothetical protein ACYCS7_05535 [Acidimicrobiales bacterium]